MAPLSAMASSQNINEEAHHNRDWERLKEIEGIKFKPTDEVLTGHFLAGKVSGLTDGSISPLIQEVDVYQYEPSKLKSKAYDFGDGNMYFFSPTQKKYENGLKNLERKAKGGFWKTGRLNYVTGNRDGRKITIGTVRSLTYHTKSGKGDKKTQWLMKEYMLPEGPKTDKKSMALCVVYFHGQRESENAPNDNGSMTDESGDSIYRAFSTPELPSSDSYQNMQDMMSGSSGAPVDSNIDTPNYCPSTFKELEADGYLPLLYDENYLHLLNDNTQRQDQDLFGYLSSSVDVVSSFPTTAITPFTNQNQDPSCLNSADSSLWYPAPNVAT